MTDLNKDILFNFEMVRKRGFFIFRKYSNYNFYFVDTDDGLKEIKKIHIYENGNKLFTMNKPWFNNKSEIFFEHKLRIRKNVGYENDQYFYTYCKDRRHIELHLSNSFVGFKKIGTEETSGFYKKKDVYETDNINFGYHKEDVFVAEDKNFIKKIQNSCVNNKKSVFTKISMDRETLA